MLVCKFLFDYDLYIPIFSHKASKLQWQYLYNIINNYYNSNNTNKRVNLRTIIRIEMNILYNWIKNRKK